MLNSAIKLTLLLALLQINMVYANKIYKHVDDYGNVTYTDDPPSQDAEKLKLKPLNTTPPVKVRATPEKKQEADTQEASAVKPYKLRIATPANDYQVGPSEQILSVVLMTQRPLEDNHFFQLSINGERYEQATKSNNINVNITRSLQGRRLLTAAIVNNQGLTIDSTPAITIYVIRPPVPPRKTPR